MVKLTVVIGTDSFTLEGDIPLDQFFGAFATWLLARKEPTPELTQLAQVLTQHTEALHARIQSATP